MQIYNYSKATGEFLGTSSARPDPLDIGQWLIPAAATTVQPPEMQPGKAAVFAGTTWTLVEDHRATPCWAKATGQPAAVTGIGPIPEELTTLKPPAMYPLWTGTAWAINTAAVAAQLVAAIDQVHQQHKYANFVHEGHAYYADESSIDDIERTSVRCDRLADTTPIPTPPPIAGCWLSVDRDAAGNRVAVPFTVLEFHHLADAIYDKIALLWSTRIMHVTTLESMAASGATLEQLMAYDITTGWY